MELGRLYQKVLQHLYQCVMRGAATSTVGNYAFFGGGSSSSTYSSTVNAYSRSLTRSVLTSLSEPKYRLTATTVGNYALFGGGSSSGSYYCSTLDYYRYSENNKTVYLYKGAKYKFQNMDSEQIYSSTMGSISIPTPATGYIKIKNTTIS